MTSMNPVNPFKTNIIIPNELTDEGILIRKERDRYKAALERIGGMREEEKGCYYRLHTVQVIAREALNPKSK